MSRKSAARSLRIQALQQDPDRLAKVNQNCRASCVLLFLIPIFSLFLHYAFMVQSDDDAKSFDLQAFGSGEMFDIIAENYDVTNRVLALRMDLSWRRALVSRIKQRVAISGSRILDVATGTADVALLLAEAMPKAQIIGVDPSVKMLQVGVSKINSYFKRYSPRIELEYGDVRELQSQSNRFDGATMSFGIRNVPQGDRQKALCEIHRVLKPDSVFAILEFGEPDKQAGVLGFLCSVFIKHIVPFLGGILTGHPRAYRYLQQSIDNFPSPSEFITLLEGLRCDVRGAANDTEINKNVVGYFKVDELVNLNFGSVQLYTMTALLRSIE